MRSFVVPVLVAGFCGLSAGCSGDRPAPNFPARLEAALAISDAPARDAALATVADSAAAAAEADVVKRAVSKIGDGPTRDRAADRAALKLANAGRPVEAVEVARLINDAPLRDRTLSRLTK